MGGCIQSGECWTCNVRYVIIGVGVISHTTSCKQRNASRAVSITIYIEVIYLHPWELDPAQPRMQGALLSKARHYFNLDKTEPSLRRLLDDFIFGPIDEVVKFPQFHHCESQHQLTAVQNIN